MVKRKEYQSGYICEAGDLKSAIFNNPSGAVTTLYQQLFKSGTRFSGPLIMGHDKMEIGEQLLKDVNFHPFCPGFKLSFFYSIGVKKERTLFVQEINKKNATIKMYQNFELKYTYIGNDPNDVWRKVEWHIVNKMQALWNYHLRKYTLASIQWNEFFNEWYSKTRTRAMLSHAGCTNITLYKKDTSSYEFWTRSGDPSCNCENLHFLYISGFLHPFSGQYCGDGDIFWNYFHQALEANKKGYDGKRRILFIIAEKFSYNVLMEKLKVAQSSILKAKKYARINGPGCVVIEKPIRKVKRITSEQKQQLDSFFQNKAHIIMSSYKTDAKTGQPVVYLKNTKNVLWEKFKETFPNGIKRTTFYTQLMDITNLIKEKINNVELQREYEEHLVVTDRGVISYDPCINHCLLYAFGECNASHTCICNGCQEVFQFFQDLKTNLNSTYHEEIQEYQDRILYYLAHQTRKTYLRVGFMNI
ncbi:hypothetical protein C1646_761906 [Rhizophagus diaphanus]|nr:hypothetical protein C1646_761906 [Rhizophagus diaphanus] [Rhizophagus sp. MUCL 43196]